VKLKGNVHTLAHAEKGPRPGGRFPVDAEDIVTTEAQRCTGILAAIVARTHNRINLRRTITTGWHRKNSLMQFALRKRCPSREGFLSARDFSDDPRSGGTSCYKPWRSWARHRSIRRMRSLAVTLITSLLQQRWGLLRYSPARLRRLILHRPARCFGKA